MTTAESDIVKQVVEHQARVVTTGMDAAGRSRIVSDDPGQIRWPSPVVTSTVVWESRALPATIGAPSDATLDGYLPDPGGGVKVFTTAIAPDQTWAGNAAAYEATIESAGLGEADGDRPAGFHQTPTVDILTVISGEIYALLDDGETLLKQGDTLIQQGGPHGWSNRSDQVAILSGVMLAANPPPADE